MAWSFEVPMLNGSTYKVSRLLGKGESNAKLSKSEKTGRPILTYGLSLAPSKASGFQLCPHASAGCIKGCLYKSGQAIVFKRTIIPARIAKSRMLRMFPNDFKTRLMKELGSAVRRAQKLSSELYVRLNVFSDIDWTVELPEVFTTFKDITFYDYSKDMEKMDAYMMGWLPSNYHLTFSRSENNWDYCVRVLEAGHNVAIPFHVKRTKPLPTTFKGYPVIDGDLSDLRPLDEKPRIVGLRAKGPSAIADHRSGFVIEIGKTPKAAVQ